AAVALAAAAAPAEMNADVHARIAAHADALARLRFVLRVQTDGGEREIEGETTCIVIDASGLLLCSNTELGGYVRAMGQMLGGRSFTATPSSLEIFLGDADEPLGGQLLTRDSDRDLAWVQIERDADASPLAAIDLDAHVSDVRPGSAFFVLRPLDPFFGRAPLVTREVIGAVTEKPRRLLVPATPLRAGFGAPVFDAAGKLIGLTVLQMPESGLGGGNPVSFISQGARMQDMIGGVVLPAREAARATQLAREIWAEDEALDPAAPADDEVSGTR
ncbi:MAG: trypsin-like peptidase domain-containing protein, partial [Acidobacteriota bacterium]